MYQVFEQFAESPPMERELANFARYADAVQYYDGERELVSSFKIIGIKSTEGTILMQGKGKL